MYPNSQDIINAKKKDGPAIPNVEITEMIRSQNVFLYKALKMPSVIPKMHAKIMALKARTIVAGKVCSIIFHTGRCVI